MNEQKKNDPVKKELTLEQLDEVSGGARPLKYYKITGGGHTEEFLF